MNKQALEARAAALQTELDELKAEIAKPELPAGYISFIPTEKNEPPCHPKSTVDFICQDGEKLNGWTAENVTWSKLRGWNEVVAYKVTKEYVEPRLMKYSELPVGQWFMWSKLDGRIDEDSVYMKTFGGSLSVCIRGGGYNSPGYSTFFSDSLKFYSVKSDMTRGELLTVSSEKK